MSPVTTSLSVKEVHYYRSVLIMEKYKSEAEALKEEGQGRSGRREKEQGREEEQYKSGRGGGGTGLV